MRQTRSFFIFILLLGMSHSAQADDPNSQTVEEALKTCRAAFIGRIISMQEISHSRELSQAEAKIMVVTPLFGNKIRAGRELKLRFKSRYFSNRPEPGFSAHFQLSNYYLITLKSDFLDKDSAYQFESQASNLSDIAFRVTDYEGSEFFTPDKTRHYYQSIYESTNNEQLELNQLVRWVAR